LAICIFLKTVIMAPHAANTQTAGAVAQAVFMHLPEQAALGLAPPAGNMLPH